MEVNWITPQLPISEEKLQSLRKATLEDPEMQLLRETTMNGWQRERSAVPEAIQAYWSFNDEISYSSGLLFKGAKLIVPNQMRREMLEKIHESHLGISKCKERGRDILYWPGMSAQIEDIVSKCAICNEHKNSHPREPLLSHPLPGRPWA